MSDPKLLVHGDDLALLTTALAQTDLATAVFRAIDTIAARRMASSVFSASRCWLASDELERLYTSRPEVYPVGARKSKRGTSWAKHVLRERKVFVGEGPLEMAAAFDDQEKMASIGVRSIINVPVVADHRCAGVLAFGRNVERVAPEDVLLGRFLGIAAAAAFIERSVAEDGAERR